ncbi:hypothetical protein EVAR_11098_1 [Eumeta japonica]|uniref:Uncharacterized protein n=1 Tax=Eumeta variegata TaxID=151549 RepID=A0A4C1U4L8_EUMVA|nr:hypothetical protein EVAR_11098_1 [Eumeta japonica]
MREFPPRGKEGRAHLGPSVGRWAAGAVAGARASAPADCAPAYPMLSYRFSLYAFLKHSISCSKGHSKVWTLGCRQAPRAECVH